MVKFYTQTNDYSYPFPTVTLAYFLRYPNPFSTHVLSTDILSRNFDPETQQLSTTRLHLKRSKLPPAILAFVPKSFFGAGPGGDSQTYILEHSIVDVGEGWMRTESRNLEWTGVLSVVERQEYRASSSSPWMNKTSNSTPSSSAAVIEGEAEQPVSLTNESTTCKTTVTLYSRLGQRFKRSRTEEQEEKVGFFRSWSQASIQRSIEAIGYKRASKSQPNATEGMKVVLERLRQGGLVAVLDGMRRDKENAGFHLLSGESRSDKK